MSYSPILGQISGLFKLWPAPADRFRLSRSQPRRLRGLIRPTPFACTSAGAAYGKKRLLNWHYQAILPSSGRPLGECRFRYLPRGSVDVDIQKRHFIYVAMAFSALLPSVALSQPTYGSLIGEVDGDPMSYECGSPDASGRINCEFIQVLLSPAEREEDLAASIAQIPEILSRTSKDLDNVCGEGPRSLADAINRFKAGEPAADGTPASDDPRDLDHFTGMAKLVDNLCAERTAANVEAFIRFTHERSSKTCRPFINKYDQTFVKVSETMWVAESSPLGPCGLIQASRFTLPDNGFGRLWEYTSQKIITNPAGDAVAGMSCSDLDRSTILYTWNSGPQRIDCEFIH